MTADHAVRERGYLLGAACYLTVVLAIAVGTIACLDIDSCGPVGIVAVAGTIIAPFAMVLGDLWPARGGVPAVGVAFGITALLFLAANHLAWRERADASRDRSGLGAHLRWLFVILVAQALVAMVVTAAVFSAS